MGRESLLLDCRVIRVIQVVEIGDVVGLDGLKLLLEVFVRHYFVVPAQRLNYHLAVLVHDDRLAQVTAPLICELSLSNCV